MCRQKMYTTPTDPITQLDLKITERPEIWAIESPKYGVRIQILYLFLIAVAGMRRWPKLRKLLVKQSVASYLRYSSACLRVISSAYSRFEPEARPRARRVRTTPFLF